MIEKALTIVGVFLLQKRRGVKEIKNVTKATEMSNAKIQFVSLVDAAANQRQFLLAKAKDKQANFTSFGKILKADKKNHYVTGIVYEPKKEDSHGDFMTEEEITKAAYYFAKNSNQIDLQHNKLPLEGATVVESWIAKADFTLNQEPVQKGTWLMTVEIANNDIWNKIEKGEITGFSMGGVANFSKEDKELENLNKQEESKKGLFKQLAEAFGLHVVEKSGKKMSNKNKETLQNIYENMGTFLKEFEEPEKKKEEQKMTKEEVEQIVTEAVKKVLQEKETPEPKQEQKQEELTPEKVEKMVEKALQKALEPKQEKISMEQVEEMITKAVTKAVEPVLKSKGLPSNLNDSGTVQKAEEHYLHGIL